MYILNNLCIKRVKVINIFVVKLILTYYCANSIKPLCPSDISPLIKGRVGEVQTKLLALFESYIRFQWVALKSPIILRGVPRRGEGLKKGTNRKRRGKKNHFFVCIIFKSSAFCSCKKFICSKYALRSSVKS